MMAVSGIILAGGKSSRMGEDKGLMDYHGKRMVEHVLEAVTQVADDVVIISNQEGYEGFGYPVLRDEIKESGPLAGIVTGLKAVENESAIVVACDVPHVTAEILKKLAETDGDIVICRHDAGVEPLVGCYGVQAAPILETALKNGTRKVTDAFEFVEVGYLELSKEEVSLVRNVNSKEDMA